MINTVIKTALFSLLLLMTGMANAIPLAYVQGQHYQTTESLLPVVDETQKEVVELFMYTCPHCYHLEPEVEDWKKAIDNSVRFTQMPAVFSDAQKPLAAAFYAAQAMGVHEKLHPLLFEAIHEDGLQLNSNKAILDYVAQQGIDRASFDKMMSSFAVKTKVKKAAVYTAMSGVGGVPSFVVNGRYFTSGPMAGSIEDLFQVVDFLVEQDSAE